MIRNQDDLTEILSIEELECRKDAAYEELQAATIAYENADKEYLAEKDIILQTIESLCSENIAIDKELRQFRKLASDEIIFDFMEVYRALLRLRIYKPNNTVLVEHFPKENALMERIDELRAKEEEQLQLLRELNVARSVAEKALTKATTKYKNVCMDLEVAKSYKILFTKEEEPVDYTPSIQPAALNDHLDGDRDLESVNKKGFWTRFVLFLKKIFITKS